MSPPRTADLHVGSTKQDPGVSRRADAFALVVVAVAGVLVLVPVLSHGIFFGPYDILRTTGLNKTAKVKVHNATLLDQITLFIPWTNLVWTQVHHGHLPLWNPYSALGTPLAFNWESAPLSLPALIGYLFPVRLAYTVQVIVTVVVAGTGVYVLGRVLRLGILGAMTAAIVFELSGRFIGMLGWPLSSVMSWGGWLLAGVVLVLRGEKKARAIVLLAVAIAFAIYAGYPEGLLLLGLSAAMFAVAMLLLRARALGGSGPVLEPALHLGFAVVAGSALAAPLILPGLQLDKGSNRNAVGAALAPKGLPPQELLHFIFQGFDGLPIAHDHWFGVSAYEFTCAYVGVTVLVLAALALVLRWRRPEVRTLALVGLAMGLLVFVPPLVSALDRSVTSIYWIFALEPVVLALAVLSGIGMDVLVTSHSERRVQRVLGFGFAAMGVLLVVTWLLARRGLTPSEWTIRSHSFIWPAIEVVTGLAVVGMLVQGAKVARSRLGLSGAGVGKVAGSVLLLVTTGFLVASGASLFSSSSQYPSSTPAVSALTHAVGGGIVAFGTSHAFPLSTGILVNDNLLYGVQEFATYDPLTPRAYFSLADAPNSEIADFEDVFTPTVTSTRAARLFGISYLVEPVGVPGPRGAVFDRDLGSEDLYRIPGAAAATLVALRPDGSLPDNYANGAPVEVTHPSPNEWRVVTDSDTDSVLRLRLSNVPGWGATVDGKPVAVHPFARIMLEVRVPSGHHVIELTYWPKTLSVGIVLALCAALGLVILLLFSGLRSRKAGALP